MQSTHLYISTIDISLSEHQTLKISQIQLSTEITSVEQFKSSGSDAALVSTAFTSTLRHPPPCLLPALSPFTDEYELHRHGKTHQRDITQSLHRLENILQ